ncbi:DnaT-like ssDNA-binding domain-containing protein [Pseudomonas sp. BLCC-B13]|uniref:DnaT-like ssDNA-binding domain-containing protein n=1 Tax=Pseudomonas sp. BLCC-B13 TaxID=3025314 RepID=UPI00234FAA9C|nr:DnaT-like ssDNA-binding domain-containing protein [Pseudomonas sp. BLCC-B13]MDC7825290.1 DnaT-like ssDNA-binding domain-containing protein [Pseudomonas sp. BLCC-B13]
MAGDWIKMRTDLLTSPKVVRMASALNADRFRIVGGLLSVWSLFDAHSADGSLSGYSLDSLDELAAWPGFAAAMAAVGWLVDTGESLDLPRFEAHNGASAKRRAQDADRKRGVRKLSASDADEKRTREEKRRDKEQQQQGDPPEDARQRFVMVETWRPDEVSLATHLKMIGVAPELVTDEAVAEFVSYWLTRPDTANNQGGWCRELVTSIKRARVRSAAKPAPAPKGGRTSQHTDLKSQNLRDGLEANPDGTYSL